MSLIAIERRDGFQSITMRWSAQNPGFGPASFDAVAAALRQADLMPEISCTLFSGVPRCFCLGTDAAAFGDADRLDALSRVVSSFFVALINAKKPMLAAVDGTAMGLGMTMLLHFDAVFATPESVFKAPFTEWGLSPEAASSILLPEALGYRKAFEIFCLGGELTADEACRQGLVTRVVPQNDLADVARSAALRLARLPSRSLATTRDLMRQQRNRLARRASLETAVFQGLLGEATTQSRLKIMGRAARIALKRDVATISP